MKYFKKIRSDVPVDPFLNEIASVDDAWASVTGRQEKIAVQREALAIPLRGLRKSMLLGRARRDVHESRWTTGSIKFPIARAFLEDVATGLDADLGRGQDRVFARGAACVSAYRPGRILPLSWPLSLGSEIIGRFVVESRG